MQDQQSKYAHVGLAMTTLVKVRISSLMSTILIHRQKDWNVVDGSVCSCSYLTWKLTSCAMRAKVLRIASWVPVHSSP